MNPAMQYTNLYDFHAVTFATTLLLASFYFLIKQRYFLLTIFLISSGITKEQVWSITSLFGFPLLLQKAKRIKFLGIGIIMFSLALFIYFIWYIIPQNLGSQHFALAYYSDFGNSPTEVVENIFLSPLKIIPILFENSRLEYLKQLFMPMVFLSILAPVFLVFIVPDLLINLLSSNPQLHQIYYQYSATITPFIFISSIFAVKTIIKWFPKIPKFYIGFYLLVFTIISCYLFGPLPGSKNSNLDMFTKPYSNKKVVENFLLTISEKYSVATTNNLGAHLSHRQNIATIPKGIDNADIVLFLLNDRFAQPSLDDQIKMVNEMKSDKNYIKIFEKDDFVVFKKQGVLL